MSQQFCLKWNNHTTNMLQVFESLLSTEALVDVTLACDGLSLKAHKMVLSACSPFFQSLFLENPCKHPIVIMKDMRYCDLKAIIDFMYRGEVNVSHDQLSALLKTAETLKVKGLAEVTGENRHASGIVQQEITQQSAVSTPTPTPLTPNAQRTDTPPLQGKRKRGRPRKRSLSDSNRSDDEGVASKIKERDSPDVEELSGDASMDATSDIRSGGGPGSSNSQSQVPSHSSNNVNSFSKSHLSISQDSQVDETSGDENEFEVEPSKLLEQTLTTDNVPSSSQNSTGHIQLPSVSGLEISRRSMSSTDSLSQALVPASDSLGSNLQAPDSPQDIKPQILSFDDPPISPVAGPSHSERSMMMYMDQSGVSSIPGPSNYQDNSALVPHDSQPQDHVIDEEKFQLLDNDTPQIVLNKAKPRLKFQNLLNKWRKSEKNVNETINSIDCIMPSSECIIPSSECIIPSSECIVPSSSRTDQFGNVNEWEQIVVNCVQLEPIGYIEQSEQTRTVVGKKLDLRRLVARKLPTIYEILEKNDPQKLSLLQKHKLNRLIVDTYIENFGSRPTTEEKVDLAKHIVETFPVLKGVDGEGYEQWFCPGTKSNCSTGFIAQRFRNYRQRKLSSVEKIEHGIQLKSSQKPSPLITGAEDNSVEFNQKKQWLKENNSPTEKIVQYMIETFKGRRYMVNTNAEGIVREWPKILNPDLIDLEFTMMYGEAKSNSFCLDFLLVYKNIILQAKSCGRKSAEDAVKDLKLNSDNEEICCAILLLPLLLPQNVFSTYKGSKKIKVKPTAAQSSIHFIQFIPLGEDLDKFMKEGRLLGGERRHPFILCVGPQYNPHQVFVVLEENLIPSPSLLKAVDLLFKITVVLNLEFSNYCKNVWQFLNEMFYKCDFQIEIASCVHELKNKLFVNLH